jgi:H+-transporting ATPase
MRLGLLNDEPLFEDNEPDYHAMENGPQARNTSYLPGRSTSNRPARHARATTGRDYVEARQTMSGTGTGNRGTTSEGIRRRTQAALDSGVVNRVTSRQTITAEEASEPQHHTGLSHAEAERLLQEHGPNAVLEQEVSIPGMFFKQFTGLMPICMAVCVVICAIALDFIDLILIVVLLITNGVVGFQEEYHAYCELQSLIDSEPKTCRCIREGKLVETTVETADGPKTIGMLVDLLVPGDVVSIKIGDTIPADCVIIEGSVKMDTKAVTGEPVPWKVPRPTPAEPGKYAENEKGMELWGTCPIMQGECEARVIRTGANSICGEISADLAKKEVGRKSDFELKILLIVKLIISSAFGIGVLMFLVVMLAYQLPYGVALKAWVAVLMGSIPIALPLVLLVVMSMGVGTMAREKAVVSDAAALSDIASITVLNSDKTGTLTTAIMDIDFERIHAEPGFSKMDILEFAVVCSNRKNKDDAIDGAIIRKYDAKNGGEAAGAKLISDKWKVIDTKGFNNAAKRTQCTALSGDSEVLIIKGLPPKVLKNDETPSAEDEDNSHTRFECKDYAASKDRVIAIVHAFEDAGLKTIGVSIKRGEEVEFAGILPMMDPARPDASMCVKMLQECGIEVKMVTGDAVNIAKTTAGDIGIGTNILPNSAFSELSGAQLHKSVLESNGFAQVMPKDKETVVVEERAEGWIVGFCGDGANDALALNAAHVGIAVADAMDAAIKASAIQLLDPGLQCIFTAVVESRKIFRRIKAYVVYRLAATIQMILTLSVLTFVSGCNIDLIYVVLLALFNDLSMIMIGQDNQKASKLPDRPNVMKILAQACCFGLFQLIMTLIFFYLFNDPGANIFENVKDSYHVEPVTWINYQQSRKGFGNQDNLYPQSSASDRVNKYQKCMQTICPMYRCGTHNLMSVGGLVKDKYCSENNPETNYKCSDKTSFTGECKELYTNGKEGTTCSSQATTSWNQKDTYAGGMSSNYQFYTDANIVSMGGFCPDKLYTPTSLDNWQECCVQFADLQHPGKANYGAYDNYCTESTTIFMFLQILVASEFMIFPVRALSWMWTSKPAWSVTLPVFGTVIVLSCLAAAGTPDNAGPLGIIFAQKAGWKNLGICAAWGVLATFLLDAISVTWVNIVDGSTDEVEWERVHDRMDHEGLKY